jgi:hypothetical protein
MATKKANANRYRRTREEKVGCRDLHENSTPSRALCGKKRSSSTLSRHSHSCGEKVCRRLQPRKQLYSRAHRCRWQQGEARGSKARRLMGSRFRLIELAYLIISPARCVEFRENVLSTGICFSEQRHASLWCAILPPSSVLPERLTKIETAIQFGEVNAVQDAQKRYAHGCDHTPF